MNTSAMRIHTCRQCDRYRMMIIPFDFFFFSRCWCCSWFFFSLFRTPSTTVIITISALYMWCDSMTLLCRSMRFTPDFTSIKSQCIRLCVCVYIFNQLHVNVCCCCWWVITATESTWEGKEKHEVEKRNSDNNKMKSFWFEIPLAWQPTHECSIDDVSFDKVRQYRKPHTSNGYLNVEELFRPGPNWTRVNIRAS